VSPALTRLFALACGLTVANLYYAQPLLGVIGGDFQVSQSQSALIVTLTQVGYAVGLLAVVPLGDLLENRALITRVMTLTVVTLVAASFAPTFPWFAGACLLLGVSSVVAQILVPLAAYLSAPEHRGQTVGQVMSGLLLGILLARAAAGLISEELGWRNVYRISAGLLGLMVLLLARHLPARQPQSRLTYWALLGSLWSIFWEHAALRRRAIYQVAMMGTFSIFWTAITFHLSAEPFRFSQAKIGLFALIGAAGALCAPWAGRLGDRGFARPATGAAFLLACLGFVVTGLNRNLVSLITGALLIDVAVQTTLILGQQTIYQLSTHQHSRLNTLYIATFFLGGAAATAASGVAYTRGGWPYVVALGAALPALAFLYWLGEPERAPLSNPSTPGSSDPELALSDT
jgi:predicted MFS family arabinose efflux permease